MAALWRYNFKMTLGVPEMVNWRQFTLDSVQAAMFTPDHSTFVGGRVVATILRQFGEQFNGEMQVLPSAANLPSEIPRVVLQNRDKSKSIQAGPGRFKFIWNRTVSDDQVTLDKVLPQCIEVLEYYVRETRTHVGRLGLVVQRSCPDESPAQTLIRRFCTPESQLEPFNRSATFEIHNHKEYSPSYEGIEYKINSWVRCQCGIIESDNRSAIVVIQDLNTLAADVEQHRFDVEKIRCFFSMASIEAETIIKKYFPE